MANHSSVLPGELYGEKSLVDYSTWGHRVRQDRATHTVTFSIKKKKNPAHCKGKQLGIHLDLGVK